MNVHAANKRSACDRCREQKLRCPRSDKNSLSCARCLRAGATCFTSSTRPPGRPRVAASPGTSPHAAWRRQHPEASPARVPLSIPRDINAAADAPMWSDLEMDMDPANGGVENPAALNISDSDLWAQLDVANMFGGQPPDDSLLAVLNGNRNFDLVGETTTANHSADVEMPMRTENSGDELSQTQFFGNIDMHENRVEVEREITGLSTTNTLIELSRMNECTARQLSELDSYPWRSPQMEKYCSERSHLVAGNPMAQALQSTARFSAVLQRLTSAASSDESSPATPITTPSSDSGVSVSSATKQTDPSEISSELKDSSNTTTLSTSILLLILSNYMQLLQLWTCLLSRAYDLLRQLPAEVFETFRAPPDFHITGLPSMKGRLYGKLLIHIVQDQLSNIDQLLALPSEYRLSSQAASSEPKGIFSDSELRGILELAMTRSDTTDGTTGKALIGQLRDVIGKALGVLGN